jgi:hypothetical protein
MSSEEKSPYPLIKIKIPNSLYSVYHDMLDRYCKISVENPLTLEFSQEKLTEMFDKEKCSPSIAVIFYICVTSFTQLKLVYAPLIVAFIKTFNYDPFYLLRLSITAEDKKLYSYVLNHIPKSLMKNPTEIDITYIDDTYIQIFNNSRNDDKLEMLIDIHNYLLSSVETENVPIYLEKLNKLIIKNKYDVPIYNYLIANQNYKILKFLLENTNAKIDKTKIINPFEDSSKFIKIICYGRYEYIDEIVKYYDIYLTYDGVKNYFSLFIAHREYLYNLYSSGKIDIDNKLIDEIKSYSE